MADRYNCISYKNDYCENLHHNSSNQYSSFSSTLLDAVYRSIDQGEEKNLTYRETMRNKQSSDTGVAANMRSGFKTEEAMANFQRACMIEKWMEKKASEKIVARSNSVAELQKKVKSRRNNSSSGSSDSSCGGGFFSSSEAEPFPAQRPKPFRTGGAGFEKEKLGKNHRDFADPLEQKPKNEGKFLMTKSRALKIYSDLKKVKQPISPGGKLAGFLNSVFTTTRKLKIVNDSPSVKSANTSTCSSASSFSRSCLSRTPSSGGKSKRSVKFYPISVIVDEDCQPCGHKSLPEGNSYHYHNNNGGNCKKLNSIFENENSNSFRNVGNEDVMVHVLEKTRRVEEVARDLLRNYQKKSQMFDEEFDDDGAASYASSDLFELDNLSLIGMERYYIEELPVYETTYLDTNRAIANGVIL